MLIKNSHFLGAWGAKMGLCHIIDSPSDSQAMGLGALNNFGAYSGIAANSSGFLGA
jgi:hypothetical protein